MASAVLHFSPDGARFDPPARLRFRILNLVVRDL